MCVVFTQIYVSVLMDLPLSVHTQPSNTLKLSYFSWLLPRFHGTFRAIRVFYRLLPRLGWSKSVIAINIYNVKSMLHFTDRNLSNLKLKISLIVLMISVNGIVSFNLALRMSHQAVIQLMTFD